MRGLPGLIIAAALGIVGAICNWAYLARQASRMEKEAFVALKGTAQLNLGDRFLICLVRRLVGNGDAGGK